MSEPVIGLDFGDYNSFVCCILDRDVETKTGGVIHDLISQGSNGGIPSVFFYSKKTGILCGEEAVGNRAKPVQNRIRYLKRHLGEPLVVDDKIMSYDFAIAEVVQHCIRRANEQLKAWFLVSANRISLSYPAMYTLSQRQRMIEIVESATLEDGTRVKVCGTIAEPAAVALDYLAEHAAATEDATVLVYNMGGGSFDVTLLSAFVAGRKRTDDDLYYYDIISTFGTSEASGKAFDEIMYDIISKKFDVPIDNVRYEYIFRQLAEATKEDLSFEEQTEAWMLYEDEYISVEITRKEFELAARELLVKTINATKEILNCHPDQQPDLILLTGGASQMPMVQRELEAALPKFKGRIMQYRPSRAIAYGAARFGTQEAIISDMD